MLSVLLNNNMFKSIKIQLLAAFLLFISLLIAILLMPEIRLKPEKIISFPVVNNKLAIAYRGHCVAKLLFKMESDKLLTLNFSLLSMEDDTKLASSELYFNTIGQLIASNSKVDNSEIITNGIEKINLQVLGKNHALVGPITTSVSDNEITIEYSHGVRSGMFAAYLPLIKNILVVDLNSCRTNASFEQLISEFKNA